MLLIRCPIYMAMIQPLHKSQTVAIIDSQSVKTTELANSRGFDAHKKVKGRKRHIVTDANVSDNRVAIELLKEVFSWQITIQ